MSEDYENGDSDDDGETEVTEANSDTVVHEQHETNTDELKHELRQTRFS